MRQHPFATSFALGFVTTGGWTLLTAVAVALRPQSRQFVANTGGWWRW